MLKLDARIFAIVLLALWSSLGWARDFPRDAKRGAVLAFNYPAITIGSKTFRMVPATRIFNEQNMIIMPTAMPAKPQIMYQFDMQGFIRKVWLLTPAEVKALGPAPMK